MGKCCNIYFLFYLIYVFWLKRVLDRGPEHWKSKMTLPCLLIIIALISSIIIYYIIIKLLIMENHPRWNWKRNSFIFVVVIWIDYSSKKRSVLLGTLTLRIMKCWVSHFYCYAVTFLISGARWLKHWHWLKYSSHFYK